MVSPLVSKIKEQIAKGFKGKLCTGSVRREVTTGVDTKGDVVAGTVTTHGFEGIRGNFNAVYAARAGIPLTDVDILILLGTIDITPTQNDKIFIGAPFNKWHQPRRILEVDPAGASMRIQAYEIPAP